MSSSHPITAGGAAAEYTHKFKKHLGDRPTSFALSAHSANTHTSSSIPASLVMDPFPASASTSTSCFPRPPSSSSGSAPSTPTTSSTIQQTFTPASTTPVRPGNVNNETHNTLANLGYRIRAGVNQGYLRSSSSSATPFVEAGGGGGGGGFRSERDVLANVRNTRRGWSRVSTAPSVCATFDGLREGTEAMDTDMDTASNVLPPADVTFKRGRSVDSDTEEEEEKSPQPTQNTTLDPTRRIAGMPKLSFTSSTSSACSFSSSLSSEMFPPATCTSRSFLQPKPLGVGGRTFSRSKSSSTFPFTSNPNNLKPNFSTATEIGTGRFVPCEDEEMSSLVHSNNVGVNPFAAEPAAAAGGGGGYDFSAHFDRTDF